MQVGLTVTFEHRFERRTLSSPNLTQPFRRPRERLQFITPFSACRYLNPFKRYLRSKSTVALKLSRVVRIQILRVQAPQKLYPNFHLCLVAHHVHKFSDVIPTGPNVIFAHMLNSAPFF